MDATTQGDGEKMPHTIADYILCNGIPYRILAEEEGWLQIRRPNGQKVYTAQRLPNHPLRGENRGRITHEEGR